MRGYLWDNTFYRSAENMGKTHLKLIAPSSDYGTIGPQPPVRRRNADVRAREYLTDAEVELLMKTASNNRHGHRNATMILVAYRHGLRVSELVTLRWDNVDFSTSQLHVNRAKNGSPAVHPLRGPELRALRRLKREQEPTSSFMFTSDRGAPLTSAGFRKLIARLGIAAKFNFLVHPHMLRHACGFKLANEGHDTRTLQRYLGHKNIHHTVRYTELTSTCFKDFWKD
jgi:integrase